MTPYLTYLAWAALLTALLWVPYIVGQVMSNGFLATENYKDPTARPVPLWAQRANRAHINSVEAFAPFAALVLLGHVGETAGSLTTTCAAIFFWARLGHAIIYMAGIPYLRTIVFTIGSFATVGVFWDVIS